MTNIRFFCLAAAFIMGLTGCKTPTTGPQDPASTPVHRNIIVVEHPDLKPMFRSMGVTVFNNHSEPLPDPAFSISSVIVQKLKARGHEARTGSKNEPGLKLELYASSPYGQPLMTGVGVFQRRPVMMKWGVQTFCNISGILSDPAIRFSKSQPIHFGDKAYFFSPGLSNTRAAHWSEFSPEETAKLTSSLLRSMDEAASFLLTDLGL